MKTIRLVTWVVRCAVLMLCLCASWAEEQREKGTPEAPADAKAIAGSYYRGDGTGFNIYLTLEADGKYTAVWRGCLGEYGEAAGSWALKDKSLEFTPSKEEGKMKGHLKRVDILKFKGQWIFAPTEAADRAFYDQWGVSRFSCFQKQEKK